MRTPDHVRRTTVDHKRGHALSGDLSKRELVEALSDLRFERSTGYVLSVIIDADVRGVIVAALRG